MCPGVSAAQLNLNLWRARPVSSPPGCLGKAPLAGHHAVGQNIWRNFWKGALVPCGRLESWEGVYRVAAWGTKIGLGEQSRVPCSTWPGARRVSTQAKGGCPCRPPCLGHSSLLLLSPPRRTGTLSSPKPQLPPGHNQPSQDPHHEVDMNCQLVSVSLLHR